jgi:threonine dehydrogenase-like Zn-dependent dehydrogenase
MPAALTKQRPTGGSVRRRQMRAAAITGPQMLSVREGAIPCPGPGEIRVRLEGCGVCASNLPVWEGRPWFGYPLAPGAPGHEGWGTVDALGEGVEQFEEGDRVAVLSYHAFAEYDVAPATAAVRIPEVLGELPVPAEPLGCAMNIFERADIQPGQRIAVVGVGFLGSLLVQLAAHAGAEVLALSRRPCSLQVARRSGAHQTFFLDDRQVVLAEIKDQVGAAGCERVIEATGKQLGLDVATQLIAERGKLVIAGYHQDGVRQVNMQLWNWRGIDVINAHERKQETYIHGMNAAMEALAGGDLDFAPLLTHRYEMNDLATALKVASKRPDGFIKAYITCTSS